MVNLSKDKKFIVVRFAPGSAGKFLSTLLQLSNDVNSWESIGSSHDEIYSWFQTKFQKDFKNWQKNEPEVPYYTDFVSNRFPRGDSVTLAEALNLLKDDRLFQEHWSNTKKIVLILNKSTIPLWIRNNCVIVNILVNNKDAIKWVHRAIYSKLFLSKNNKFIVKQDHPEYCNNKRGTIAKNYNNITEIDLPPMSFIKQYVIKQPLLEIFKNQSTIINDLSNLNVTQHWVNLSNLISSELCVNELSKLFEELGISPANQNTILALAKHYEKIHKIK